MTFNDFKITVNKNELIHILIKNRKIHMDNFYKAVEVYKEDCIIELSRKLKCIADAPPISECTKEEIVNWTTFPQSLRPPVHFQDEYDQIIDMLQMHELDTVTLNSRQFDNLIKDEWDWTHSYRHQTLSKLSAK